MLLKNFTNLFFFKLIFLITFILPSYSENWHTSSGSYKSLKYSELETISSVNVKDLNLAWIYKNGFNPDKNIYFRYNNQATPIFTGKSLIVTSLDDNVISVDPETGKFSGREPLKTLAKYRKFNGKVVFGQNLIPRSSGKIEVGMKVELLK